MTTHEHPLDGDETSIEPNELCRAGGTHRIDWHRRVREGREAAEAGDVTALGDLALRVCPPPALRLRSGGTIPASTEYRSDDGLTLLQQEQEQGLPCPERFSLEWYAEEIGVKYPTLSHYRAKRMGES
jgi:hypothetical protein